MSEKLKNSSSVEAGDPFLEIPSRFFFQIHFLLIGSYSSYKLAQGASWPCKVFNTLALKVIKNRLSGNKHCTLKIVFRNRNAFESIKASSEKWELSAVVPCVLDDLLLHVFFFVCVCSSAK